MLSSEEQVRFAIAQQAAEWFVRHRAEPLDASERRAFDVWLAVSPVHVEEYLGVAQLTQDLPPAGQGLAISMTELLIRASKDESVVLNLRASAEVQRRERRWPSVVQQWRLAGLVATLAGIGIVLLWQFNDQAVTVRLVTHHGEQRTSQLADNSVLQLNTDTVVTVHYTRRAREVSIERGQAYFDVTHGDSRPFRVRAGVALITDLGTKFDVYHVGEGTTVTVVEGQIGVESSGESVRAKAGEQVTAVPGALPPVVMPVDVQRSTAWRHGVIVFDQKPLGEVVSEFNRYGATPIEVESPALARLQVSGVLSTTHTSSFIVFLRSIKNVDVDVEVRRIRVRERLPARVLDTGDR